MSAGSAFLARGPATESARSQIGEAVDRAKIRLARRSVCQCNQIGDVVWCIPASGTTHKNTQFVLYTLMDQQLVQRMLYTNARS